MQRLHKVASVVAGGIDSHGPHGRHRPPRQSSTLQSCCRLSGSHGGNKGLVAMMLWQRINMCLKNTWIAMPCMDCHDETKLMTIVTTVRCDTWKEMPAIVVVPLRARKMTLSKGTSGTSGHSNYVTTSLTDRSAQPAALHTLMQVSRTKGHTIR